MHYTRIYNRGMAGQGRTRRSRWNWLLLLPLLAIAFPALYTREQPALWGFPFFYWYQFAAILGTAMLTGIVYGLTRAKDAAQAGDPSESVGSFDG
jgi:hypothetical protein